MHPEATAPNPLLGSPVGDTRAMLSENGDTILVNDAPGQNPWRGISRVLSSLLVGRGGDVRDHRRGSPREWPLRPSLPSGRMTAVTAPGRSLGRQRVVPAV